ncbi:MAG TPA: hypothetical protein VKQ34_03355, partial [Candidatus Saccharimonadales bacterium]|nr:hypothetical protein [Candidatus Saccharimonadales bacterium]
MIVLPIALLSLFALVGAAYITNPFSRFTIIKRPFVIELVMGAFQAVNHNHRLRVAQRWWWRLFATLKCFIHILETRYVKSTRSETNTLDGIIDVIHRERFNPEKLLLTSGDHFSNLFVRNLGVFYYPMCDGRIPSDPEDWHNRQVSYLQTVAYALGVFEKYPVPTTTIVPTGAYRATCMNYWRYPSDTVYGLLYALAALLGKEEAAPTNYAPKKQQLDTPLAADLLLQEYRGTLIQLYNHYRTTAFDEAAGLLRRDVYLCGAKDITRRACSFYDNVVFWKTTELAMELGLLDRDESFLRRLKRNILTTFWLEKEGYFLEELSDAAREQAYYSSDWLIVLVTGFLDPAKKSERHYFERSVAYIQQAGVDAPLPLKYQAEAHGHKQFFLARIAFASYQRDTVWSFW